MSLRLRSWVAVAAYAEVALGSEGGDMCVPASWNPGTENAYLTHGYVNTTTGGAGDCCSVCEKEAQCTAWNWKANGLCFRYSGEVPPLHKEQKQKSVTGTRTPPPPPPPPMPPPPKGAMNVLMIAIDDMRPELAPYGAAHMHTPNMQKL